jgi:hypothetical protein
MGHKCAFALGALGGGLRGWPHWAWFRSLPEIFRESGLGHLELRRRLFLRRVYGADRQIRRFKDGQAELVSFLQCGGRRQTHFVMDCRVLHSPV